MAQVEITGHLEDENNSPLPYANLVLMNLSDSSFVQGTLSDETGKYIFRNISDGSYFIRTSAIGFKTMSQALKIDPASGTIDLGSQALLEDIKQLEAVVVQADKPLFEKEIDRTVVNVANSVLSRGSSAFQILERSPGVIIDYQDNQLRLNGKSVTVMINGRLIRLPPSEVIAMLKGMTADNVEKIELIDTPPSGYDSDGSGGIINITLKKNDQEGTNGSLSLTGGYGRGEKMAATLSINHRVRKSNLSGSYSYNRDVTFSTWGSESMRDVGILGGDVSADYVAEYNYEPGNHNLAINFDYEQNAKTTWGTSLTYNTTRGLLTSYSQAHYYSDAGAAIAISSTIGNPNTWQNILSGLYFEKKFREGESVTMDVDYLLYQNQSPSMISSTFSDNGQEINSEGSMFYNTLRGKSNTSINIGVVKIDYAKRINSALKFESGVKNTYSINANESGLVYMEDNRWVQDTRTDTGIKMIENIAAAHMSFRLKLNAVVELAGGSRYEYTYRKIYEDAGARLSKRGQFFPSVFISRKLTDISGLQLSYTRRTSRPAYNDLTSYLSYVDPMSVSTGNPLLRPVISNTVKGDYTYNGYVFSIVLSRDNNPIARYQITEGPEDDILYISPQNVAYQNNAGLQGNLPFKVNNWWSMNLNVSGGWRQFRVTHTKQPVSHEYFAYNLSGSQTFTFPAAFSVELSGWYNSPLYDGATSLDGFGMMSIGFKKEFRKIGTLQLSVQDLFNSMRIAPYRGKLTEEAFSIKGSGLYRAESSYARIVKVSYFRNFGNKNLKGKEGRSTGSGEERNRVRRE